MNPLILFIFLICAGCGKDSKRVADIIENPPELSEPISLQVVEIGQCLPVSEGFTYIVKCSVVLSDGSTALVPAPVSIGDWIYVD